MELYNVDFSKIDQAMYQIKCHHSIDGNCDLIRSQLNVKFQRVDCKAIIYTNNTDKMFFGMKVKPFLDDSDIANILSGKANKVTIKSYAIEFDSKLFQIGLSAKELTACLLHELGHVINDIYYTEYIKNALSSYISYNKILKPKHYDFLQVMRLGVIDAFNKIDNIFFGNDEEKIADEFVVACGYGNELMSAINCINQNTKTFMKRSNNMFTALEWAFKMNVDLGFRRLNALRSLLRCSKIEGSKLIKDEIDKSLYMVEKGKVSLDEGFLGEKISAFRDNVAYSDLRAMEDDYCLYKVRISAVDEKDEALIIIREINDRLAIIDSYLRNPKLKDRKRWEKVYSDFCKLRLELGNKKLYNEKFYGLFVKKPVIHSRYESDI